MRRTMTRRTGHPMGKRWASRTIRAVPASAAPCGGRSLTPRTPMPGRTLRRAGWQGGKDAVPLFRPLLEGPHQSTADALTSRLGAYQDLLDPGDRTVRV